MPRFTLCVRKAIYDIGRDYYRGKATGGEKTKKIAIIALIGALALVGTLGAVVMANPAATTPASGRIYLGEGKDTSEANDAPDIPPGVNATITAAEAKAIAEKYTGGTATAVHLENENGYLVYGVEITNKTGTYDVKVDTGNGTVLKADMGGNEVAGADNDTIENAYEFNGAEQGEH